MAVGATFRHVTHLLFLVQSPAPSPTGPLRAPPPGGLEVIGAVAAIALALAAGILGYRIIRGGRGL